MKQSIIITLIFVIIMMPVLVLFHYFQILGFLIALIWVHMALGFIRLELTP